MVLAFLLPLSKGTRSRAVCQVLRQFCQSSKLKRTGMGCAPGLNVASRMANGAAGTGNVVGASSPTDGTALAVATLIVVGVDAEREAQEPLSLLLSVVFCAMMIGEMTSYTL